MSQSLEVYKTESEIQPQAMELIIANINLPMKEDDEFSSSLERGNQPFGARNSAGKLADR